MADPNRQVNLNGLSDFNNADDDTKNDVKKSVSNHSNNINSATAQQQNQPLAVIESVADTQTGQTKRVLKFGVRFNTTANTTTNISATNSNSSLSTSQQQQQNNNHQHQQQQNEDENSSNDNNNTTFEPSHFSSAASSRAASVFSRATSLNFNNNNTSSNNNNVLSFKKPTQTTTTTTTTTSNNTNNNQQKMVLSMKFDPLRFRPRSEEAGSVQDEIILAKKTQSCFESVLILTTIIFSLMIHHFLLLIQCH